MLNRTQHAAIRGVEPRRLHSVRTPIFALKPISQSIGCRIERLRQFPCDHSQAFLTGLLADRNHWGDAPAFNQAAMTTISVSATIHADVSQNQFLFASGPHGLRLSHSPTNRD